MFTIGIIQDHATADVADNVQRAERLIRTAASRGAQIICLKELFNAPYFCKSQHPERFDLAEPIPGPTTDAMRSLARELAVVLIVPIFERQAPGLYRNTAAVIDADGSLLGVYRKMHIPDDPLFHEKYYFTPGDSDPDDQHGSTSHAGGFRVWRTRYATIGVLICWDQWYPEAARITSLMGAQVLFYPTAIGWHPSEKAKHGASQRSAWQAIQRSHAIANGVYVAVVNRIGHERPAEGGDGVEFWGTSFLVDPFGIVLAEASPDREEILVGEVSLARIDEVRTHWPFLRDRRVDAYAGIERRFLDGE
jgi:N-carbamoylputrescine amidase